ncbi:MAG: hypothetical protein M3Z04_16775 [Chloroflexota bacterium]|nr:hypothetical protein [Chloroflexota bacterium]
MQAEPQDALIGLVTRKRAVLLDRIVAAHMARIQAQGLPSSPTTAATVRAVVDAGLDNMLGWLRESSATRSRPYFVRMVESSRASGLTDEQTVASIDLALELVRQLAWEELGGGTAYNHIDRRLTSLGTVGRMMVASEATKTAVQQTTGRTTP